MPRQENSTQPLVSSVNHIALMTRDLDRLAQFYVSVFDAAILARTDGTPRKYFLQVSATTNLHMFEMDGDRMCAPGDDTFDPGSINHFALEASDPDAFVEIRRRMIEQGRASESVADAPHGYTIFATDPDGLFLEVMLSKPVEDWHPPFPVEPFRPL